MTDEQLIRAAILDVIDDGDQDKQPWILYERPPFPFTMTDKGWSQDDANGERLNFCDAAVTRIQQLRQLDDTAEANHPR